MLLVREKMETVDLLWRPLWAPASQVPSADSEQFKMGLRLAEECCVNLKMSDV